MGSTSRISSPGDSASLSNVDVSNNTAGDDGGGLYVGNHSPTGNNPVTLTNVTADNNTASGGAGGGLYVSNDTVLVLVGAPSP